MASSSLGIKRHCPSCGARYYDLNKDPAVCPACEIVFDPEAVLKSRRFKPMMKPTDEKKPVDVLVDDDLDTGLDDVAGDLDAEDDSLGADNDLSDIAAKAVTDEDEEVVEVADTVLEEELYSDSEQDAESETEEV